MMQYTASDQGLHSLSLIQQFLYGHIQWLDKYVKELRCLNISGKYGVLCSLVWAVHLVLTSIIRTV